MKLSNLLLLGLGLISLAACTEKKTPKSLASKWQQNNSSEPEELLRSVASLNSTNMCLKTNFNVETLKSEIAHHEKSFSNKSFLAGVWKHLDLTTLPYPQAQFLSKHGNSMGDLNNRESIDYSGCFDVPCIFNRVYGKDRDYIAGYVHYLWYLKFGSYLAADNSVGWGQGADKVGVYGNKSYPLSFYLYNEEELYGLWRITHLLKDPFTNLTLFREVQRLPRGAYFEGSSQLTCGIASSLGTIQLNDGCLAINKSNHDEGFLYIGVIHEMVHILDFHEARTRYGGKITYRSHEGDYINVAGFYREEYTDNNGKLVYQWKTKPGARAIRDYASVSPAESFADTLAYFRQSGDETKRKITNEHFSWVSSNYYSGETYDVAGNRERLVKQYGSTASRGILSKVIECSKSSRSYRSDYFSAQDFPEAKFAPGILRCLSYEAQTMAEMITARVKTFEPDGCGVTNRSEKSQWDKELKNYLRGQFAIYVKEMVKDPDYLQKVGDLEHLLANRQYANEAIFECYNGSIQRDLNSCYQGKIEEIITEISQGLRLPEDQSVELVQLYKEAHPYSVVTNELYSSLKGILDQNSEIIERQTQDFWQMCLDVAPSDSAPPRGRYFKPLRGYAISSIANCLNDGFPSMMTQLLRSVEYEGEKIVHPKEEQILLEFIQPRVSEQLTALHQEALIAEKALLRSIAEGYYTEIQKELLGDFSWVTTLDNQQALIQGCRDAGLKKIDYLPRFHTKRETFGQILSEEICAEIASDPSLNKFTQGLKSKIQNEVYPKIDGILYAAAEERALHCRAIIPWKWERTRATVRIPRQACLTLGWGDVEDKVVNELSRSFDFKALRLSNPELRQQIQSRAPQIRSQIEQKHF